MIADDSSHQRDNHGGSSTCCSLDLNFIGESNIGIIQDRISSMDPILTNLVNILQKNNAINAKTKLMKAKKVDLIDLSVYFFQMHYKVGNFDNLSKNLLTTDVFSESHSNIGNNEPDATPFGHLDLSTDMAPPPSMTCTENVRPDRLPQDQLSALDANTADKFG